MPVKPMDDLVYNYALTEGHAPGSWSDAVISIIHKENRPNTLYILPSYQSPVCRS